MALGDPLLSDGLEAVEIGLCLQHLVDVDRELHVVLNLERVEHQGVHEAHLELDKASALLLVVILGLARELGSQVVVGKRLAPTDLIALLGVKELLQVGEDGPPVAHDRPRLGPLDHILVEQSQLEHDQDDVEAAELVQRVQPAERLAAGATCLQHEHE